MTTDGTTFAAEARALSVADRSGTVSVEFELRPGETLVVHGPVDAGTALARAAVGLSRPTSGSVRILGQDPAGPGRAAAAALMARVGYLARSGSLLANLTLRENLLLPLRFHWGPASARGELVATALRRFGLDEAPNVRPEHAPLHVRRRVALARAVLLEPELLVLDHPTDDLEPDASAQIKAALAGWARERRNALLVASPDPTLPAALGARAIPLTVTRP